METAPTMREMYERVSDHLPLSYQYSLRSLLFAVFMASVAGKGMVSMMRQQKPVPLRSQGKVVATQSAVTVEELTALRTSLSQQRMRPRPTTSPFLHANED